MKQESKRLSELKHKLRIIKQKGEKDVCWKLNNQQAEYLIQQGFELIPELYLIHTRKFYNVNSLESILKQIHYGHINGKKNIARKLKKREIDLLHLYDVRFHPIKYKIIL